MRVLIAFASGVGGILLFLLASASSKNALFARNYPLLLGLNGAIAAILLLLVIIQLVVLWRQYRERQFGSRLKLKLLGLFALMAVVPGAVVYGVSMKFATRSIESWFNVPIGTALDSGVQLGRNSLDYLLEQLASKTRNASDELADAVDLLSAPRLERLRESVGADTASIMSTNGRVLVSTAGGRMDLLAAPNASLMLRRAKASPFGVRGVEGEGTSELILRVIVPIPSRNLSAEPLYLQTTKRVPDTIARSIETIQTGYRDYQELVLGRQGLLRIYSLTLTLTLLLALFAAIAAAFEFARSLSAPLLILAEGTRAVAAGDFSPRQALPSRDELGVLTQSFNRMTSQLQEARALAERNRVEVESARGYLESVLVNLSAGVLAFADNGLLRAANRGAMQILRDELQGFEDLALGAWPRHDTFQRAVLKGFDEHDRDWHQQLEIPHEDGHAQVLLVRGSRLPGSNTGYVVVFDDVTELISAQRNAAWAEVARRLAHEIKNPLTPIQLSAERLQLKLSPKLDEDAKAMLARATRTIVNQVEAMKNMVNDFRDYARLPAPQLTPLDLNGLVREVLGLYESSRIRVEAELPATVPLIVGDATQLRQVIHNLMQNAEDAMAEQDDPVVRVLTRLDGRRVEFVLRDNGPGFPPALMARVFEPYVTTKSRGSGLGLAIVKKIIDEHHGTLQVANIEPRGAEIRIRLPLASTV